MEPIQLGIPGIANDIDASKMRLTVTDYEEGVELNYDKMCLLVNLAPQWGGEHGFYCPILENIEDEMPEGDTMAEKIESLIRKWSSMAWDYTNKPTVTLVDRPDLGNYDTVKCEEFEVFIYKEEAVSKDYYDRPYEETPETRHFASYHAMDCFEGSYYSKDFGYFDCEDCHRCICEQNPSNGWMVQYKWRSDCDRVCNKCFTEGIMENGINESFIQGGGFSEEVSQVAFFNHSELRDKGWSEDEDHSGMEIGMGYTGYTDEKQAKKTITERIKQLDAEGFLCLLDIDSMAIGGLGGYLSLWTKPKAIQEIVNTQYNQTAA